MLFSPQPLVREVGERDHVGPFVLRFPISVCTPADRDEVELRSSSTKGGTLCPVSGLSALDRHYPPTPATCRGSALEEKWR